MADHKRGNWARWPEFLFSCIGSVVGLGNIWRFPYICFKNGGAVFLIPYLICMFLCTLPMIFLEIAISQYSNLGPAQVWNCCPLFKDYTVTVQMNISNQTGDGIGYGIVIVPAVLSTYYNVILAWILYYLAASFTSTVPWANCNNQWNTNACYVRNLDNVYINKTSASNITVNITGRKLSTEEYWERNVLEISDDISQPGIIRWQLCLCLIASWIVVFLCLVKGIKSSGKVVYVTATLPYLFLLIMLIRGLTLPGSLNGLRYFMVPKWSHLLDPSVWSDAAIQTFFSIGIAFGVLATFSSYNQFNMNCYRHAMVIPLIDTFTSWFAGCAVFSTLGYIADRVHVSIEDVVDEGPGLIFLVYPEALSTMPIPQLWSVLFFIMMFLVGIDSLIGQLHAVICALTDTFPNTLLKRKMVLTAVYCFLTFLIGLVYITQGGIYVLQLIDWYLFSVAVLILAILEVLVLGWLYGADRLYEDIEMMIGFRPCIVWKYLWKFINPVFLMLLLISSITQLSPVKYGKKSYPQWARTLGLVIAVVPLIPVPIFMVKILYTKKGNFVSRVRDSIKPNSSWQPALHTDHEENVRSLGEATIEAESLEKLENM